MTIDYDKTAAEYEASLVTKLRGHGAGSFLEHWVPDPDPVLGIFNMIEAAWTAGQKDVELVVARSTLDGGKLQKLKELASSIADVRVDETPSGYTLFAKPAARKAGAAQVRRPELKPGAERRAAQTQSREVTWDIHPSLAGALDKEAASMRHEGPPAESGKVALVVDEKTKLIQKARHAQMAPAVRRKIVELMCRSVEGKTVQDASDHAGTYVIHLLQRAAGQRPTAGILLPANAGLEMMAALKIVRAACGDYLAKAGSRKTDNFFELPPSAAWRGLEQAERLRRIDAATVAFCKADGVPANSMKAVRVEKDIQGQEIRVIVQVNGQVPHDSVPLTLRRLERHLKVNVEPVLQVYLEPLKDLSVLRRL